LIDVREALEGMASDISELTRLEEERRAHLWFLESLDRINRAMQGTNDLEAMVSDVLDAMLDIFACHRAWLVYPCDPDAPAWTIVKERARPEYAFDSPAGKKVSTSPEVQAMFGLLRASPGAVAAGEGNGRPLSDSTRTLYRIQAILVMALYPKSELPHAFGLHQCASPRVWTPHERRLFEEIGHRLENSLTSLLMLRNLRQSEHRLDESQRIAHVGYWERDLETGRVVLSDETCRIFGFEPERTIELPHWQQRWQTLVHPEDRQRVGDAVAAAQSGGPRYDVEYRIVRPDGEVRVVRSRGEVTWRAPGEARRMFGVMQDITELRHAETELRASEIRFRTFVDHATDSLFVHDEHARILDVNQQACLGLGYTREELIGMGPADFDACVAEDVVRARLINQRLDAGEMLVFETSHRRKDGSTYPAEVRVRPFWHDGKRFALALARDITERKQAEEEREQMRRLESERETAIATERTRLAGEIHDTLAQGLAMIVMQLADAEAKLGPEWARAAKPLDTVRELAVESLAYARRSLNMLRPRVTAGGLTRSVRDVVDSLRRHFAGEVSITVKGDAVLLPAPVESALASIAHEALSNAIRHSGATQVGLEIEFAPGGAVRLIVADAGAGFDTSEVRADAYGLISMNERASRAGIALTFVTEPGAGTEVVASWSP
jgi:PAS domain S-box-containing protein